MFLLIVQKLQSQRHQPHLAAQIPVHQVNYLQLGELMRSATEGSYQATLHALNNSKEMMYPSKSLQNGSLPTNNKGETFSLERNFHF